MKKIFFLIFFLIAFQLKLSAQGEKEIQTLIENFAKSYSEIDTVKDTEHVLRYVSKDLKSSLTDYDAVAGAKTLNSDYFGLVEHLNSLIRNNLKVNYKVDKITKVVAEENFAYAIYEASYETYLNRGKVKMDYGNETVMMSFVKSSEGWKILNYYVFDIKKEVQKTSCYADVFKSESEKKYTQLVVKLSTPDGKSVGSDLLIFVFEKQSDNSILVKHNEQLFTVDITSNLTKKDSTNKSVKLKDSSDTEIAFAIIKNFTENSVCNDVQITSK